MKRFFERRLREQQFGFWLKSLVARLPIASLSCCATLQSSCFEKEKRKTVAKVGGKWNSKSATVDCLKCEWEVQSEWKHDIPEPLMGPPLVVLLRLILCDRLTHSGRHAAWHESTSSDLTGPHLQKSVFCPLIRKPERIGSGVSLWPPPVGCQSFREPISLEIGTDVREEKKVRPVFDPADVMSENRK